MFKFFVSRGRLVVAGVVPAGLRARTVAVEVVAGRRLVEGAADAATGRYRVEFRSRRRLLVASVSARLADGRLEPLGRALCLNVGETGGPEASDLARQMAFFDFCRIPAAPARRERPAAEAGLSIQWIIPDFHAGAGGLMNVFRLAGELELKGHRNTFWIMRATRHDDPRMYVKKHYAGLEAEFRVLPMDGMAKVSGDVVVATNDESAWFARGAGDVAAKVYLVQDYEPAFQPAGTAAIHSRATYGFGFKCVAAGAWLRAMLEREGCAGVRTFDFVRDEAAYFPPKAPRAAGARRRVAFYARSSTPRRAVPLGVRAFELLAARRDDFEVHLFGQDHGGLEFSFPHVDRGVLSPGELGALYRSCDAGVVFSATNHSIAPLEMMACGLPVVELAGENNALVYAPEAILLARAEPEAIADAVARVLDDAELAARLRRGGFAHAEGKTWARAGAALEAAIIEALAEGSGR